MAFELEYLSELTRNLLRDVPTKSRPPVGLDWPLFLQLCSDHCVAGTLLPLVPPADIPEIIRSRVEENLRTTSQSTILRLLFLERILPRLEESGCRPIVLKGGALAVHYYPRPEQRYLADLDILVEPDQVDLTCSILAELGLEFTQTRADPHYYRNFHFHWIMGNKSGFVVEVHWALTLPQSIYNFDLAGLRSRSLFLPLNKSMMRVPAPADLLLHMVTQCTAGGFGEMRRVIDTALIYPEIEDPLDLIRQAKDQNQSTALWLLLTLVRRWTGVEVPVEILDQIHPGYRTARLLERLAYRMLWGQSQFEQKGEIPNLLHWLCAPNPSLRKRELWRFLSPGAEYWQGIGYPPDSPPPSLFRLATRLSRFKTVLYLAGVALKTYFGSSTFDPSRNS